MMGLLKPTALAIAVIVSPSAFIRWIARSLTELKMLGSALIEELFKEGFSIDASQRFVAEIELWTVTENGERSFVKELSQVTVVAGRKEARLEANLVSSPLRIDLALNLDDQQSASCRINLDYECWRLKPVLTLPYYDLVRDLVHGITEGSSLELQCNVLGNQWWKAVIDNSKLQHFAKQSEVTSFIAQARAISEHFHSSLTFPETLTVTHLNDIRELFDVITMGSHHSKNPGVDTR